MEVPENLPFRHELQSLIFDKLTQIGVTPMNEAMIHGIEDTFIKAFEAKFQFADTGIRSVFFHIAKMTLMDMIHQENLETILMKSLDRHSQTEKFTNAHSDNPYPQKASVQTFVGLAKRVTDTKNKNLMEEKNEVVIKPLQSGTQYSSQISDFGFSAWSGLLRHHNKNFRKYEFRRTDKRHRKTHFFPLR